MYPESSETKSSQTEYIPEVETESVDKITVNRQELMAIIAERDHFRSVCGELSMDIGTFIQNGKALLGPFLGKRLNPLTLMTEIMSKATQLEQYIDPIVLLFDKYAPLADVSQPGANQLNAPDHE